jgi:hypothetical protein
MDYDEQVVHTHGQDQKGHNLYDNKSDCHPEQVKEADGPHHRKQHHQHAEKPNGDLHVDLEVRQRGEVKERGRGTKGKGGKGRKGREG